MRHLGLTVAFIVMLATAGIVGLIVGEAVPDRWVLDALIEARDSRVIDGDQQPYDANGTLVDEFTECITLSVGVGEQADAGLFTTIAEAPNLGSCPRLLQELADYQGGQPVDGRPYLRYWHGSSAAIRPLLPVIGVDGVRVVALASIVASLALLFRVVRRQAGPLAAAALITPYVVATGITSLPAALNQAAATSVAFATAALVGVVAAGGLGLVRVWYAAVFAGAAFVYVDLLTIVPGAWLLPAAIVGLVAARRGLGAERVLGWSLWTGIGWFTGYAAMWASKWVFAAAVLGRQRVIDDVRNTIETRINGDSPYSEPGFGNAVEVNVEHFVSRPFVPLLLGVAVLLILATIGRDRASLLRRTAIAAPAVVPLIWYEVASNHSQVHFWFTYRSLALSLGVVLLAFVAPRPPTNEVSQPE